MIISTPTSYLRRGALGAAGLETPSFPPNSIDIFSTTITALVDCLFDKSDLSNWPPRPVSAARDLATSMTRVGLASAQDNIAQLEMEQPLPNGLP